MPCPNIIICTESDQVNVLLVFNYLITEYNNQFCEKDTV